ncbi:hypothetical protein K1X41_06625 [Leucobacter luti]|nr:hypothetical protein K1X41_06625 [Leucobacter luti]
MLLAVLVLFIPVVKRVRSRSRRGSGTVETRVLGAWEELLDAHADAGTPEIRAVRAARSTPTASRRDLGALIPGGLRIAAEVDHAVFSGEGLTPMLLTACGPALTLNSRGSAPGAHGGHASRPGTRSLPLES